MRTHVQRTRPAGSVGRAGWMEGTTTNARQFHLCQHQYARYTTTTTAGTHVAYLYTHY